MTSGSAGIALTCATCALEVVLEDADEAAVRTALAAFFTDHDGCRTSVDLSRARVPLPRRPEG